MPEGRKSISLSENEQWGYSDRTVTFPVAFASTAYMAMPCPQGGGNTSNAYYGKWKVDSLSKTGFTVNDGSTENYYYIATGK